MIPTAAKLEQRDVQRSGIARSEHEAILFQALTEGQAALLISCTQARVCGAGRNRRGEERGSFKCKRNAWHGVDTYMREAACSRYVNDTGSWFVEVELTLKAQCVDSVEGYLSKMKAFQRCCGWRHKAPRLESHCRRAAEKTSVSL
jgi:hypothetical protein